MPTQTLLRPTSKKQRLLNPPNFANARYIDIQQHWRRVKPFFYSEKAFKIWKPCMEECSQWKAEDHGFPYRPRPDARYPKDYDGCDWRCRIDEPRRRGPDPAFWDFVCHAACHWLVDLNLYVAWESFPELSWRILTVSTGENNHSTVWDGSLIHPLLFDANFLALGIPAQEALRDVWNGRELRVGQYLKGYLHQQGEPL